VLATLRRRALVIIVTTLLVGGAAAAASRYARATPAWSATTSGQSLAGDVAVGPSGKIYAVGPSTASSCGSSCSAYLDIIVPPSSGGSGSMLNTASRMLNLIDATRVACSQP